MKLVAQTARHYNVLYVATDGREAKLAKGAFDKSHPHLTLEFTTDVHEQQHVKENGGCDALLIGWSVRSRHARAHRARASAGAANGGHRRRRTGTRTVRAGGR